jgi:N-acyl-D-amino-acid deacylase
MMTALLPGWLLDAGYAQAAQGLGDPIVRAKVRRDCDRYWRFIHKGEWDRVRLQSSPQLPELDGLSFPEIAARRGQDVWDRFFDSVAAAGEQMESLIMIGRLFTEEHSAQMVSHPLFSLGVDTFSSSATGPLSELVNSPQPYCGHIHYLSHHVRERHTLTLEEAIRKMTAKPAARFRLAGRGMLRPGYFADVVVFDFDKLSSASTFDTPTVYPQGIDLVLVNGVVVVDKSGHCGTRPGRVLRRAA